MADCFVLFSEVVPGLTHQEEEWVDAVLGFGRDTDTGPDPLVGLEAAGIDPADVDLDDWPGFNWAIDLPNSRDLSIYSEDGENVAHVAAFVRAFLRRFRPSDVWTLTWAETCSKPGPGDFGGGAAFVTADTIEIWSAYEWLRQQRERQQQQRTG